MINEDQSVELDKAGADVLAGKICAQAALQAQVNCGLLEMIGQFDVGGGLGFVRGAKSVAHWVSYTCSMAPGTAREHVRVAKAMRQMPTLTAAFRAGELSYSKMREATRLVGVVDEQRLCRLALAESASQFARTVQGFRSVSGSRMAEQARRKLSVAPRDEAAIGVSGRFPVEEGAVVQAALRRARDLHAEPPEPTTSAEPGAVEDRGTPEFTDADALLVICEHYLATAGGRDESGEDRHLVVVEVAAEQLAGRSDRAEAGGGGVSAGATPRDGAVEGVPGGTPAPQTPAGPRGVPDGTSIPQPVGGLGAVPAGTPDDETVTADRRWARDQKCRIRGAGGIEPETARRLLCAGTLLGAVVDAHGDVLALGRSRRLVSKAQRRALMLRDETCRFPGCVRRSHLQAHHRISWADGGVTDVENLLLLCQFHHTVVHEGGISIDRTEVGEWEFLMPDGQPIATAGWRVPTADRLTRELTEHHATASVDHVDSYIHPDAIRIRPQQYGERFSLHDSVQALSAMVLPQDQEAA